MKTITEKYDALQTSMEILEAIEYLSDSFEDQMRIWEGPEDAELLAIWERVTKNGLISHTEFAWGDCKDDWYNK